MTIFVGSSNPAKITAVKTAVKHILTDAEILSVEVESGISSQPKSDDETRQGAQNRAMAAVKAGLKISQSDDVTVLGVGLEGGVHYIGEELWSTVWVSVVDAQGQFYEANGAKFRIPQSIAQPIIDGEEMGPIVERLVGNTGNQQIRHGRGAIGVITKDFTDRIEEYSSIAKMAFGVWYGREWELELEKN